MREWIHQRLLHLVQVQVRHFLFDLLHQVLLQCFQSLQVLLRNHTVPLLHDRLTLFRDLQSVYRGGKSLVFQSNLNQYIKELLQERLSIQSTGCAVLLRATSLAVQALSVLF